MSAERAFVESSVAEASWARAARARRLLREPLVWFLAAGALLFVAYRTLNPQIAANATTTASC